VSAALRKLLIALPVIYLLFFFGLTDVGLLGPDEPRYGSIGREMAHSGDWVTPRLWGKPWFEKPALLYWMIATANRAGFGQDMAVRLPVALLSALFLFFYYLLVRGEFGRQPALFATVILGTSAAWVAFSQLGVTDLPMAATFSISMLLGLRWMSTGKTGYLAGAAASMGLSVLAKGLVPLALAVPLALMGRHRLREFFRPLPMAAFFAVAAPWYILCTVRNGSAFIDEFFWKHHFARYTSDALLHQQPFWFYVPIFFVGLFPWTPLAALLFRKKLYNDSRRRFFLYWILFGFTFFSLAANKLPGYLLPLFPAAAVLLGLALSEANDARYVLAGSCLMLLLVPVITESLPRILAAGGLSRAKLAGWNWLFGITYVSLAVLVWWWDEIGRRQGAMGILLFAIVLGVVYIKVKGFPDLDRLASARPLWHKITLQGGQACVDNIHRNWRYGLNYYSINPLPDCSQRLEPLRVRQSPGLPPFIN
jgi:4-amino-4-deoxy-L-arabinose transferase-like glycosyltransferase